MQGKAQPSAKHPHFGAPACLMWGGWETWVGRVMGTGERTVFGAENVGTAQGGDAEEESPRKGVCRGGDVEGPREPSPGEHSRGRPRGEDAGMVEGPGRGKSGGGRSEWGAHRGEWKGGHGGGGLRWKGTGQGAPQRGAIWLSCSSELTLCRAIPKPTLSLCHCSPAILKSDTGGACIGGTCWVALCVGSPLFPSTQGT